MLEVRSIKPEETYDWLKRIHYAGRIPSISFAFGLYRDLELVGIVTYGTPSSAPLRSGIAGDKHENKVLELNRLCFAEPIKNGPSMLVSRSLRLLPAPSIVVSYADIEQGHVGYVYQACNFLYTGLSAKRTDWKVKGMEHMHGQTIADMSRSAAGDGKGARADFMRQKFGDDFYLQDRARKHRYVYLTGNSRDREALRAALLYQVEPYPKGDTRRYEINDAPSIQQVLF